MLHYMNAFEIHSVTDNIEEIYPFCIVWMTFRNQIFNNINNNHNHCDDLRLKFVLERILWMLTVKNIYILSSNMIGVAVLKTREFFLWLSGYFYSLLEYEHEHEYWFGKWQRNEQYKSEEKKKSENEHSRRKEDTCMDTIQFPFIIITMRQNRIEWILDTIVRTDMNIVI